MIASSECLILIKQMEGFAPKAYQDGLFLSIGYGHHGADVLPADTITELEAEDLLVKDMAAVATQVAALLKVSVRQNQFDALVSFAYNVGVPALERSTLLRLLNSGKVTLAADQFLHWNKVNGKPSSGLTKRRITERALFLREN